MILTCPNCKERLSVDDAVSGKQVKCSACQHVFAPPVEGVPAPAEAIAEAPRSTSPVASPDSPRTPGLLSLGKFLLIVGLGLVVCARGGNAIGQRGVAKARARLESAKNDFNDKWKRKLAKTSDSRKTRLLTAEKSLESKKREADDWLDLQASANNAKTNNIAWGYWREWLFVIGSAMLVMGCLSVGFYGTGAERIICLVVIALIVFSLYVVGIAWMGLFLK